MPLSKRFPKICNKTREQNPCKNNGMVRGLPSRGNGRPGALNQTFIFLSTIVRETNLGARANTWVRPYNHVLTYNYRFKSICRDRACPCQNVSLKSAIERVSKTYEQIYVTLARTDCRFNRLQNTFSMLQSFPCALRCSLLCPTFSN